MPDHPIGSAILCLGLMDEMTVEGHGVFLDKLLAGRSDEVKSDLLRAAILGVLWSNVHGTGIKLPQEAAREGRSVLEDKLYKKPSGARAGGSVANDAFPLHNLPDDVAGHALGFLPAADALGCRRVSRWMSRMARQPAAMRQIFLHSVDAPAMEAMRRGGTPCFPLQGTRHLRIAEVPSALLLSRVPVELNLNMGQSLLTLVIPALRILDRFDVEAVRRLQSLATLRLTSDPALESTVDVRDDLSRAASSLEGFLPNLRRLVIEDDDLSPDHDEVWGALLHAFVEGSRRPVVLDVPLLHAAVIGALPGAPSLHGLHVGRATLDDVEAATGAVSGELKLREPVQSPLHAVLAAVRVAGASRVSVNAGCPVSGLECELRRPLHAHGDKLDELTLVVDDDMQEQTPSRPCRLYRLLPVLHRVAKTVRIVWRTPTIKPHKCQKWAKQLAKLCDPQLVVKCADEPNGTLVIASFARKNDSV